MSQSQFASYAGIPLRTYKRFEAHGKATLLTFVEVLRAMQRTEYLPLIFPGPVRPAPPSLELKMKLARLRGRRPESKPSTGDED